jgi:C-terminal processing protease CtpA/Prc
MERLMNGRIRSSFRSSLVATAIITLISQPVLAAAAAPPKDPTLQVCRPNLEQIDKQLRNAWSTKSPALRKKLVAKIPFNGELVYCRAMEAYLSKHVTLGDRQARVDFIKKWLHEFDASGALKTPRGVDEVIPVMIESLGQRFDGYMNEAQTKHFLQEVKGEKVGIGVNFIYTRKPTPEQQAAQQSAQPAQEPNLPPVVKEALEKSAALAPADWDSRVAVLRVDPEGPSVGLFEVGDLVLELNGHKGNQLTWDDVQAMGTGDAGTKVTVKVRRMVNGQPTDITHTVERKSVEKKSVTWKDLGDGITLIAIKEFMNEKAPDQLHEALEHAAKGKATIVTVRGNPGGELGNAIKMTTEFISSGTVLTIRSRDGSGFSEESYAVGADYKEHIVHLANGKLDAKVYPRSKLILPENMPVIFVTDNGSASASEIAAGAVQTLKRAEVVGEPSHGKGEGQTVVPLPFDRMVRVTSFEFLPGGKAMNWVGIVPDVEVDLKNEPDDQDFAVDAAVTLAKKRIAEADARAKREKELFDLNHKLFQEEQQKE